MRGARWSGALFLIPGLLLFMVFYVYPALQTIVLSLYRWDPMSPAREFLGLHNYATLLQIPRVRHSLVNTLVWFLVPLTFLPTLLGLLIALLFFYLPLGGRIFRALFFAPAGIAAPAAGIIWTYVYNPDFGVLNAALRAVGLENWIRGWTYEPGIAQASIAVAAIWGATIFPVFVFTSALSGVAPELLEAAQVEGATGVQQLRYVLLPMLAPVLMVVLTLNLIGAVKVFDIVYAMTRGGPGTMTEVVAMTLWRLAFQFRKQAGYGVALAVMLTGAVLVVAWTYLRRLLREAP